MLLLFLTISVTTSASEKTFSDLERIKHTSPIHNTRKNELLSPSLLPYAMTDGMDFSHIAADFADVN